MTSFCTFVFIFQVPRSKTTWPIKAWTMSRKIRSYPASTWRSRWSISQFPSRATVLARRSSPMDPSSSGITQTIESPNPRPGNTNSWVPPADCCRIVCVRAKGVLRMLVKVWHVCFVDDDLQKVWNGSNSTYSEYRPSLAVSLILLWSDNWLGIRYRWWSQHLCLWHIFLAMSFFVSFLTNRISIVNSNFSLWNLVCLFVSVSVLLSTVRVWRS